MLARALVALVSLSSIEASEPIEDPSTAAQPSSIETIVVDGAPDALREEIRLRLGRRTIAWAEAGMQTPAGSSIWVVVEPAMDGVVKLQFVVSDGRAYSRSVDATGGDAERAIAAAIANTVAAIEAGHMQPEATGVPLPAPPPAKEDSPKEAPPKEAPAPSPKQSAPAPPPEVEPAAWIGIGLGGVVAFGIGPPTELEGLVGGGGFGHLRFLHRTGATAALQVRGLALPRDGVVLSRVRIALTGGYAWRPNRFDLIAEAGVTVEPVWIGTFDLAPPTGDARSPAPLVGGRLALSPGVTVWTHRRSALRLGLELEIAESVEARTPAGAVQILRRTGDDARPFMRAGGLELSFALGAELRFGTTSRRRAHARRSQQTAI